MPTIGFRVGPCPPGRGLCPGRHPPRARLVRCRPRSRAAAAAPLARPGPGDPAQPAAAGRAAAPTAAAVGADARPGALAAPGRGLSREHARRLRPGRRHHEAGPVRPRGRSTPCGPSACSASRRPTPSRSCDSVRGHVRLAARRARLPPARSAPTRSAPIRWPIRSRCSAGGLKLFGIETFRRASTRFQAAQAGPVDENYRLGPGRRARAHPHGRRRAVAHPRGDARRLRRHPAGRPGLRRQPHARAAAGSALRPARAGCTPASGADGDRLDPVPALARASSGTSRSTSRAT